VLVRRLPSRRDDRREVLLLENGTGQLSIDALRGLGLTPREAETLFWTARGRSVAETAAELGIARRTIQKHLQHVYEKLGVRSASQASATGWAAVGVRRADALAAATGPADRERRWAP
jgi:DNA-binding CsgD family transcriptional regulator